LVNKIAVFLLYFSEDKQFEFVIASKSFNVLTVNNKIKAIKNKIQHWVGQVENRRMYMFSELGDYLEENEFSQNILKQLIISHLHLSQWIDK